MEILLFATFRDTASNILPLRTIDKFRTHGVLWYENATLENTTLNYKKSGTRKRATSEAPFFDLTRMRLASSKVFIFVTHSPV